FDTEHFFYFKSITNYLKPTHCIIGLVAVFDKSEFRMQRAVCMEVESMLQNQFKTAWRTILRQKQTSVINLLGLSLGIASALILFVIVQYEWSYDRFHKNYDNIYRIVTATQYENSVDYNAGI